MAERRNATETYVQTQLGLYVPKSLYDANTILAATTDDTPAPITMGASTILARLAAGNIVAATPTQIAALLTQKLPGYQWDYAAITTTATSTATTAATATAIITGASVTYDGTQVRITVNCRSWINSLGAATSQSIISIWRDSTDLGFVGITNGTDAASGKNILLGTIIDTPSAGAHTYSARLYVTAAATATVAAGAGGAGISAPAELRVVKV